MAAAGPSAADRTGRAIAAATAGFVALAIATAATLVVHGRTSEFERGTGKVQRYVAGAGAALNRQLMSVDVLIGGLHEDLAPALADGRLDADAANRILQGLTRRSLAVRNLVLLDADGTAVAAARPETLRLGLPLEPGFVADALAPTGNQLAISDPVTSPSTLERSLYFSRRLLVDGAPYAIVAELPVAFLTSIVGPPAEIAGIAVTVERDDGRVLVAAPAQDGEQARARAPLPASVVGQGVVRAPGRLDGRPALLAALPTVYPNVRLAAGLPVDVLLAERFQDEVAIVGGAAVFVLLLLATGGAATLHVRRMAAMRAEVENGKGILDRALGSMSDGFLLCDRDDRVVAWNARYADMFPWLGSTLAVGAPMQALADRAAESMIPGPDHTGKRALWAAGRLAGRRDGTTDAELEMPGRVFVHIVERRTPDGGIVGVYRDVTRTEREMRAAKVAAEAASRAKSQFLAAMSHEIRTPLNGVLGMNRLLLRSELDDDQRRCAATIQSSGEALLALINDILDLSRVESGGLQLETAAFSPRTIADGVAASLAGRATERGLALVVDAPRSLPDVLVGDAGRLRQVLYNLVGNAVKFTETGSVSIELDHRDLDDGRVEVDFAVRDTGIGIAPEVMPTLFQRFTQADGGIARRYGGSGLGLAISRELLELMGGRIALESQFGRGSVFTATVPLASAAPAPATTGDSILDALPVPQALAVLAAEDNEVNQIVVRAMIEQLGHRCDIACDGEEAVRRAAAGGYDVVLMDIQMPHVDGIEATRRIRALPGAVARVPIVALTASAMVEERAAYLAVGMNDHVAKPIVARHLARAIERVRGEAAAG